MKNYSQEKYKAVESYIENPTADGYEDFLSDRYDIVMVVDWREEDEAIIEYCENILATGHLSAVLEDADNKQGFTVTIHYKDQSLQIPYRGEGADRDTTLLALNNIIQPDYEIRWCKIFAGSDTQAFIPLPKDLWQRLQEKYGTKVDECFARFESNSTFFI